MPEGTQKEEDTPKHREQGALRHGDGVGANLYMSKGGTDLCFRAL